MRGCFIGLILFVVCVWLLFFTEPGHLIIGGVWWIFELFFFVGILVLLGFLLNQLFLPLEKDSTEYQRRDWERFILTIATIVMAITLAITGTMRGLLFTYIILQTTYTVYAETKKISFSWHISQLIAVSRSQLLVQIFLTLVALWNIIF